ncbi:unnamed protein product [Lepeophtheirus salmonis]|uniref:(salmon louse) hypothetical protein n=1 Tax=Lepeophtheirus salmonis TaxID=72036 RepID=A0A817FEP9_LEPSM|nr:unnamed protein product [Lepeophtheirus salmonis]CAG9477353.1 unnamed protein product [Lepeophtheirus salmonis]
MSIKSALEYDVGDQVVRGYDTIQLSSEEIPSHALGFALVGVKSRWKQVVAYHLTGSNVCSKTTVEKFDYPASYITTAWFCEQVGRWVDLMTSRSLGTALSKSKMDKYESSVQFPQDFCKIILSLTIGDGHKPTWKPVQKGIVLSTTSFLELSEYLISQAGFAFVFGSRFTQDCLEKYFLNIEIKTPSHMELKNVLKIVTLTQFLYRKKGISYEDDDSRFLVSLEESKNLEEHEDDEFREENKFILINPLDMAEMNSLRYLIGFSGQTISEV